MEGNNNAYNEMDIDVSVKGRLFNNCVNYIENMDKTETTDNVVTNVFETSDYTYGQSKLEKFVKCAVAVVSIGALGVILSFGKKYIENPNEKAIPAKKTTRETETQNEEEMYEASLKEGLDCIFEHKFTGGEDPVYKKALETHCYDTRGKLKSGYEEKAFTVTCDDGTKKTKKFVGKDFVYIDSKTVRKNAEAAVELALATLDDDLKKKYRGYCEQKIDEISKYDYVYFLQGESLVRVRLDKLFTIWMNTSQSFSKIDMGESKVMTYVSNGEFRNYAYDQIGYTGFDDVNMFSGVSYDLVNKDKTTEEIGRINAISFVVCKQNDKLVAYYVDKKYVLWRIDDVDIYTEINDAKISAPISDEYLDGQNYGPKIGVNKKYKAKKIAEGIYEAEIGYYNNSSDGDNGSLSTLCAYCMELSEKKEFIEDLNIEYYEIDGINPVYSRFE